MVAAPSDRTYKVTARLADAPCLLRARTRDDGSSSPALIRGTAVHTLLKIDGRRQILGQPPLNPDRLIQQMSPAALRDDPDYMNLASGCIIGMRAFMEAQGLVPLRVEEFVATRPRPLQGQPDVAVILSGRIDAVYRCPDGHLVALDVKTGKSLPGQLDLIALPSTTLYTLLARELRRTEPAIRDVTTDEIEVVQILPHTVGPEVVAAQLMPEDIAAGCTRIRQRVLDLDAAVYPPTRGEWCAYCPLYSKCPAWNARHSDSAPFF